MISKASLGGETDSKALLIRRSNDFMRMLMTWCSTCEMTDAQIIARVLDAGVLLLRPYIQWVRAVEPAMFYSIKEPLSAHWRPT